MSGVAQVESHGVVFYVQVRDAESSGGRGASTAALTEKLSFEGVANTVRAIAGELHAALEAVCPDEASVEFGLDVSAKSGRLTGLLVEGEGKASLKVTLTWKRAETPKTV